MGPRVSRAALGRPRTPGSGHEGEAEIPSKERIPEVVRAYAQPEMEAVRQAIVACQRGSRDAFEVVVKAYMRRAYFAALALVGNREDALDISQEAFVKAYRAIRRFDAARPFYPWFYRIVRNLCYDWLRRRSNRPRNGLEGEIPDSRANPEVLARRDEIREEVWNAVHRLGERDREILVLRHFQHMSYREIAEALGIPQGTVMSRLFTARSRLRAELDGLMSAEE
ncbi:MAG: RNA polymerase sigma factor [Planctomycetota bacterium]|jgi:RNA polymerase sigma-70 factor (ECF subfamily)